MGRSRRRTGSRACAPSASSPASRVRVRSSPTRSPGSCPTAPRRSSAAAARGSSSAPCCSPPRWSRSASRTTSSAIGVCWSLAIIGFCMLSAAITATISDQVPVEQRGFVSGWVSAPQALGTVLGILLVTEVVEAIFPDYTMSRIVGYALVAVLLVILVLPFFLFTRDEAMPKMLRPKFSFSGMVRGFWVNPVQAPGLRVDAAQSHPRQSRQRARHDAADLLHHVRARAHRHRAGRPAQPHARLPGVLHPRGARRRADERPDRQAQAVRLRGGVPAGARRAAAGPRAGARDHRSSARRCSASATDASWPSTRRSPPRCCRARSPAARTSAS